MPLVPIQNLGQFGVNQDLPAHRLPANVWTDVRGVRFYDNAVWKAFGQAVVLGTPGVDPYYIFFSKGPSLNHFAYCGLAQIWATTDGTDHTNISRVVGGAYTGAADNIWQGTTLGGIEVFNNGIDVPQAWITPDVGTPVIDLANWPAATTARIVKSFKQYLIALDVTKSGTRFPYLVKWSHVADPGSVPSSWDETDATLDAGEYPLAETGGHILDGQILQDSFLIYKEDETWGMTKIGGRFVFNLKKRFNTGVVSPRSIVTYKARHYVATADDIIVHDGFQQESILDDKMRRWYQGQADSDVLKRQYMVLNRRENELWHCIPQLGFDHPNIALVVNMKDGTQTLRDLPQPTYITTGPFDTAPVVTYDAQAIIFDNMIGKFGQRASQPGQDRLIGAVRDTTARFLVFEEGFSDEGSDFRAYCERASMPIAGAGRDGIPIMDARSIKKITEIWPELLIQAGTTIDIYVGGQDTLNQATAWQGPFTFTVGVDDKIDCDVTGRYISIRFETTDQSQWKLDAYSMNVEILGSY